MDLEQKLAAAKAEESPESQVRRLASFILAEMPGEPSEDEGAVDTAIRIMRRQKSIIVAAIRSPFPRPAPRESRHQYFCRALAELGLYDSDADYGGMAGNWVETLSAILQAQHHSGESEHRTLEIFMRLMNEWEKHGGRLAQP